MEIKVAERLRPFSHQPGSRVLLPGSELGLIVYPEVVIVEDLTGSAPIARVRINMPVDGPLEQFTIEQDLEKGCVRVWGRGQHGFLRYRLQALKNNPGLLCSLEKGFNCEPKATGEWAINPLDEQQFLIGPSPLNVSDRSVFNPATANFERLSLGNHKAQDWTLIRRRNTMEEILPLWHRLGQLVVVSRSPGQKTSSSEVNLLEKCRQTIHNSPIEMILPCFRNLFLAGFEGMLSPRNRDNDYQGICSNRPLVSGSPLELLIEGAVLIRSLFVQQRGDTMHLLPALPPDFHCGRLLNVHCGTFGSLSMEWTKKDLRCVSFRSKVDYDLAFVFMREKTRCRVRTSHKDPGVEYISNSPLKIAAGQHYWFDNFKK